MRKSPHLCPRPLRVLWVHAQILALAWVGTALTAQQLVRDLGPGVTLSAKLSGFTVVGSLAFFAADTVHSGRELWVTDGTAAGTRMVRDIAPGPASSMPAELVAVGRTCYFRCRHPAFGEELWASDGTEQGTRMVADIVPGPGSSSPIRLFPVGARLYFVLSLPTQGRELWTTDGTATGTRLVKDVVGGATGSDPFPVADLRGRLLFVARTNTSGQELWVTDGTAAGTAIVIDLWPGTGSGFGFSGIVLGSRYLFTGRTSLSNTALWTTDGSAAGTQQVHSVGSPASFHRLDANRVCFVGREAQTGQELWITDGTRANTRLVRDLIVGSGSHPIRPLASGGGHLYFTLGDRRSLWHTDGSPLGTLPVQAFAADILAAHGWGSMLLLSTSEGLWRTTGTPSSTVLLGKFDAPVTSLAVVGNRPVGATENELVTTDGLPAGTRAVRGFLVREGAPFRHLTHAEDRVYFVTHESNPTRGTLWTSDGSSAGTRAVSRTLERPGSLQGYGTRLLLHDRGGLYVTDATATRLDRLLSNNLSPIARYISYRDSIYAIEEWNVDLYHLAPDLLRATSAGGVGSRPFVDAASFGGLLFVSSNREVRTFDGSSPQTITFGSTTQLLPTDQLLYLVEPSRIQRYDPVSGLQSIPGFVGRPGPGAVVGSTLFVVVTDSSTGDELWRTDGTQASTRMIKELAPGSAGARIQDLVATATRVYFTADPGNGTGRELWTSDGTAAGTVLLKDIVPGALSSGVTGITQVGTGDIVVFAAYSTGGVELWQSDGTPGGTRRAADVHPGPGSSNPRDFTTAGNQLFFTAESELGRQLYRIPLATLGAAGTMPYGRGCVGLGGIPELTADGAPALGNSGFQLRLTNGRAQAAGLLFLGASRASIPVGACAIHVGTIVNLFGLTLDRSGSVSTRLPIPSSSTLLGLEAYFQAAVDDPFFGSYLGTAALSNGLRLILGH